MVDDEFHRDETDGQVVITRDPESGPVLTELYYKHGILHRQGGPAPTARDPGGSAVIEGIGSRVNGANPEAMGFPD